MCFVYKISTRGSSHLPDVVIRKQAMARKKQVQKINDFLSSD